MNSPRQKIPGEASFVSSTMLNREVCKPLKESFDCNYDWNPAVFLDSTAYDYQHCRFRRHTVSNEFSMNSALFLLRSRWKCEISFSLVMSIFSKLYFENIISMFLKSPCSTGKISAVCVLRFLSFIEALLSSDLSCRSETPRLTAELLIMTALHEKLRKIASLMFGNGWSTILPSST